METTSILKEFEWQIKDKDIKRYSHSCNITHGLRFQYSKKCLHPTSAFGGAIWGTFNPAEYQGTIIGFVGDRINGASPTAILSEEDVWKGQQQKLLRAL